MEIEIQDDQDVPLDTERLINCLSGCLQRAGCEDSELSLLLTTDERIQELNATYRGKPVPTDVLSFRQEEEGGPGLGNLLGDIVISVPTAERQARENGISLDEEIEALAVHGLLHLLGHDHETEGWESWEIALKEVYPDE
ncbi:MAG: rRNA maturation RNase YbeY [Candidatus Omnitrophica bacterium]|nr:rRNA maturation RNase YbeY [Candidatus Omnitrophota bacterium]MCB9770396.1 rRNA maturation RNase YbeY [Candidatus Omnitrophota bacterium]